jgi:hypothetical protein
LTADYHDSPNRVKLDPDLLMNSMPPVADSSTVASWVVINSEDNEQVGCRHEEEAFLLRPSRFLD